MYENLKSKWNVTDEDLKRAIDQITLGKIACDGRTIVALTDLLCNGDVSAPKKITEDLTIREWLRSHFDDIIDFIAAKNPFCAACEHRNYCISHIDDEISVVCDVDSSVVKTQNKLFLDRPVTKENVMLFNSDDSMDPLGRLFLVLYGEDVENDNKK